MSLRRILKPMVPSPVRRLAWRGYYYACENWLQPIVSCRTTRKVVALTFDDGPHPEYTPPILEILAEYRIKATFFLLGRRRRDGRRVSVVSESLQATIPASGTSLAQCIATVGLRHSSN